MTTRRPPNQLTEKGFTPAHREMAQSLNRDMYEQLVTGIAEGRKKPAADVRTLLDQGPFVPSAALEAGLVDELAYEDELDDRVPALADGAARRRIEGSDYQRISPNRLAFARSRASRCCTSWGRSFPVRAASTA